MAALPTQPHATQLERILQVIVVGVSAPGEALWRRRYQDGRRMPLKRVPAKPVGWWMGVYVCVCEWVGMDR